MLSKLRHEYFTPSMVHEMTLYLGHGLAQQRVSFSRSVFESFVNGYFAAERGQKKGKASLPLFPSLISALDLLPHFRLSPLQLDPSPLATNLAALSLHSPGGTFRNFTSQLFRAPSISPSSSPTGRPPLRKPFKILHWAHLQHHDHI